MTNFVDPELISQIVHHTVKKEYISEMKYEDLISITGLIKILLKTWKYFIFQFRTTKSLSKENLDHMNSTSRIHFILRGNKYHCISFPTQNSNRTLE